MAPRFSVRNPAVRVAGAATVAGARYVWRRPEVILRLVRGALGARFGLPLDAGRWLVGELLVGRGPRDVEMMAVPPGLRVAATIDLLGNEVRAAAVVYLEDVRCDADALLLTARLTDVTLALERAAPDSPVATLLRSGALDLSQPGNLAAFMPRRPEWLVEAHGDRVVIDLFRHPAFSDPRRRQMASALVALVAVDGVETDWESLEVILRPLPQGLTGSLRTAVERLRGGELAQRP
jgi:hypothetical protein